MTTLSINHFRKQHNAEILDSITKIRPIRFFFQPTNKDSQSYLLGSMRHNSWIHTAGRKYAQTQTLYR